MSSAVAMFDVDVSSTSINGVTTSEKRYYNNLSSVVDPNFQRHLKLQYLKSKVLDTWRKGLTL